MNSGAKLLCVWTWEIPPTWHFHTENDPNQLESESPILKPNPIFVVADHFCFFLINQGLEVWSWHLLSLGLRLQYSSALGPHPCLKPTKSDDLRTVSHHFWPYPLSGHWTSLPFFRAEWTATEIRKATTNHRDWGGPESRSKILPDDERPRSHFYSGNPGYKGEESPCLHAGWQ